MNEYDSDRIRNALNLETTTHPEKADIVIINTCSIRQKADQKALSSIGKFKHLKARKPEMIIGIAGCVAQLYGDKLLDKIPHLDLVLGPRSIPRLPTIISQIEKEKRRCVETSLDVEEVFEIEPYHEEGKVTAFVSVQQGCNKKCTYCIVPYVRGNEINRPTTKILSEIGNLVIKGVKEVTLIGQTVNSWRDNGYKFSDLLRKVAELEGLERIRFTTSYPRDVTKRMIDSMRDTRKVCRHIHLPVQSGSNKILSLMKRTYTKEWYLDTVNKLRDSIPDIAISTDIIVGFPGETEEDFENTIKLLNEAEFNNIFSFKFSQRPGTPASEFCEKENVSETDANRRLSRLQELQREITFRKNQLNVGSTQEVLVEGEGRSNSNWIYGRNTYNQIVHFPGSAPLKGFVAKVKITEGLQNSLRGELLNKN
jgi:tRNA-2-methylthio-N6-dimethylallyladenosine synthase